MAQEARPLAKQVKCSAGAEHHQHPPPHQGPKPRPHLQAGEITPGPLDWLDWLTDSMSRVSSSNLKFRPNQVISLSRLLRQALTQAKRQGQP